jgi:hypothetical protein
MGASLYSRRERKIELIKKGKISCFFCKFHRGENLSYYHNYKYINRRRNQQRRINRESIRKIEIPHFYTVAEMIDEILAYDKINEVE